MASVCKADCVEDDRVPMRAVTYANIYKWPESDAEFVKSISSKESCWGPGEHAHSRVVDSISCRQIYLRSYTFTRQKSSIPEKTKKYLGRVVRAAMPDSIRRNLGKKNSTTGRVVTADSVMRRDQGKQNSTTAVLKRRFGGLIKRPATEGTSGDLFSFFRPFLFCTAKIDVVDHGDT